MIRDKNDVLGFIYLELVGWVVIRSDLYVIIDFLDRRVVY